MKIRRKGVLRWGTNKKRKERHFSAFFLNFLVSVNKIYVVILITAAGFQSENHLVYRNNVDKRKGLIRSLLSRKETVLRVRLSLLRWDVNLNFACIINRVVRLNISS
jgi:hypothetical protein